MASCPRSASEASTSAVEDNAQANPATSATCHESPSAQAHAASAIAKPHLRSSEAEHGAAQGPQPGRFQLEADQEQQQHHSEFRDRQRRLDFADHGQPPRAEEHTCGEVAQHRTC